MVGLGHAGPYARDARVAHLERALAELRALGPARDAFELELHEATRVRCRPTATPASTACAIEVARAACSNRPDPAACAAAADVVITNQHAEHDLVDEQTRVRLVRTSANYHASILAELRAVFALLAAEFALAHGGDATAPSERFREEPGERLRIAALGAAIDQFCATREAPRCASGARGCVPSLPYQRCAAGLVWYIASHPGADEPGAGKR
jgi:hypothetical protein